MNEKIILELIKIIKERKKSSNENSYIVNLFSKGKVKIANKLGEEAIETICLSYLKEKRNLLEESADLIFHFLIMLEKAEVSFDDVLQILKKRMKND